MPKVTVKRSKTAKKKPSVKVSYTGRNKKVTVKKVKKY